MIDYWRQDMKGRKMTAKERSDKLETDANERKRTFKELCSHVASGYSLDCFDAMGLDTINKYLKLYPEEFCRQELDNAVRKGKGYWEGIGRRQSDGTCLGNSRAWYYNMANRYNWHEKAQIDTNVSGQVNVQVVSYASQKSPHNTTSNETT